eukprot:1141017-Pelagomonas_calceolata.AAC.8
MSSASSAGAPPSTATTGTCSGRRVKKGRGLTCEYSGRHKQREALALRGLSSRRKPRCEELQWEATAVGGA